MIPLFIPLFSYLLTLISGFSTADAFTSTLSNDTRINTSYLNSGALHEIRNAWPFKKLCDLGYVPGYLTDFSTILECYSQDSDSEVFIKRLSDVPCATETVRPARLFFPVYDLAGNVYRRYSASHCLPQDSTYFFDFIVMLESCLPQLDYKEIFHSDLMTILRNISCSHCNFFVVAPLLIKQKACITETKSKTSENLFCNLNFMDGEQVQSPDCGKRSSVNASINRLETSPKLIIRFADLLPKIHEDIGLYSPKGTLRKYILQNLTRNISVLFSSTKSITENLIQVTPIFFLSKFFGRETENEFVGLVNEMVVEVFESDNNTKTHCGILKVHIQVSSKEKRLMSLQEYTAFLDAVKLIERCNLTISEKVPDQKSVLSLTSYQKCNMSMTWMKRTIISLADIKKEMRRLNFQFCSSLNEVVFRSHTYNNTVSFEVDNSNQRCNISKSTVVDIAVTVERMLIFGGLFLSMLVVILLVSIGCKCSEDDDTNLTETVPTSEVWNTAVDFDTM